MDSTAMAGSRATGTWDTTGPDGPRKICKCLVPKEAFGCCWAIWHSNMQSKMKPWGLCGLSHLPSVVWRGKRWLEEWAEVRRELFMAPHFVRP